MATGDMELFARCASGFEDVLAGELRELGAHRVRPQVGGVSWYGRLADAYRICLWSRVSTRVQLVLGRVGCQTADELYGGVADIAWEDHVRGGATIAVKAHGTNENLRNTAFSALKAKDAICDRLRASRGSRPDVDSHNPDLAIDLAIHERKATVYLNLSGPSLHRRGYREEGVQTEAPLKETLAAGMLLAAGWPALAREGGVLVDPMCGSGTLAIEGALIAGNVAPGIWREHWGFEGWAQHDAGLWAHVLADARERVVTGGAARILAGDIDEGALSVARDNVRRAQVSSLVQLYRDDANRLGRHLRGALKRGARQGLLATNPPYGKRLGTTDDLVRVNEALATSVEALPEGWLVAIITPDVTIDSALGRVPERVIDCHNGPLEVALRIYEKSAANRRVCEVVSLTGVRREVPVSDVHSEQFAGRFRKVARDADRGDGGVCPERDKLPRPPCPRVYEADLPDYPYAIDISASDVTITELRRPRKSQAQQAARKLADARAIVAAVLDVPQADVHMYTSY